MSNLYVEGFGHPNFLVHRFISGSPGINRGKKCTASICLYHFRLIDVLLQFGHIRKYKCAAAGLCRICRMHQVCMGMPWKHMVGKTIGKQFPKRDFMMETVYIQDNFRIGIPLHLKDKSAGLRLECRRVAEGIAFKITTMVVIMKRVS